MKYPNPNHPTIIGLAISNIRQDLWLSAKRKCVKGRASALSLVTLLLLSLATGQALAHRSPSNCSGANPEMYLYAFRLNGSIANTITNGEKVVYLIQAKNDSQQPTPGGSQPSCDITCANFTLQIPEVDGTPGPIISIATNVNLPFGTPPFTVGSITCTVTVASSGSIARAVAQVTGVAHDVTIPGCAADGDCVRNECDPDVAFVQRFASIYVLRPGISISSSVSSVTNRPGAASFIITGVVTNCGDETLANVSIVSDGGTGKMPIKTIGSLAPGASVEYSATCTNTENRCPSFTTTVSVTATGISTQASLVTAASCPVSLISHLSVRLPKRRTDGMVEVSADCEPGWTYLVEASNDLVDWNRIAVVMAASNIISITDNEASSLGTRFYRARAVCQQ